MSDDKSDVPNGWCRACSTWHLRGNGHYPLWDVKLADDPSHDTWIPIRALDVEQAADRFMEYAWSNYDGWEWIIPSSGEGEHTVIVRNSDGKETRVSVVAEMRPHYSCREVI